LFGLLGGLMAYFIILARSNRELLQKLLHRRDRGARRKLRPRERGEHLAGYDAMLQHRRPVIGSPTWCRYMGAL
jgi:hypothetical protein